MSSIKHYVKNAHTFAAVLAFGARTAQQLGLKLGARKLSVEVLVIDHAEKPSEN